MSNRIRLFIRHLILLTFIIWQPVCQSEPSLLDQYEPLPSSESDNTIPYYLTSQKSTNAPSVSDRNNMLLQVELGRYQIAAQKSWPLITEHKKFKLGKSYHIMPMLRDRLLATGDLSQDDSFDENVYDDPLDQALKHFQSRHGLTADGVIGKLTAAQLNIPPQDRIKEIELNLQHWAELSKQLGHRFIIVNIPDYQLYLYEDNQQVMSMKAVVGKPDLPTPELTSRVTRVVFNPYWNVPDKIAAKDIIPKVRQDPYYLDDMHIKVFVRAGKGSQEISHNEIDWQLVEARDSPYDFRQEPGDDNALGLVKFEFPNPYDVYMHDTPAKTLFNETNRAFSHGCIRLENPFALVNYLMKDDPNWDELRVQDILDSRATKYVKVSNPIPIYITYITVWADDSGVVNYRNDIYNRYTNQPPEITHALNDITFEQK